MLNAPCARLFHRALHSCVSLGFVIMTRMTETNPHHLAANLAFHLAWTEASREFLRRYPHHRAARSVQRLQEREQEMIGILSRAIRQLDRPPARIEPDPRILEQARQRKAPDTLLRYLHHGMTISLKWYGKRLQEEPHVGIWRDLAAMQEQNLAEIERALTDAGDNAGRPSLQQ